jgi:hypothetical protein
MIQSQVIRIVALDKTKKAFASVQKGMTGILGSVFSLKTALGVVAGATGFGLLVKSQMNAIDALSKTAQKIGTTTEALSRLQYAGELTGVATNTMNMALQRFVRRTAEASRGTGEAVGALRELGINATQLQKLPLDQRMAVLADAFANVSSESDQLRLAFKLFDSEGASLVNTLRGGSDALNQMYDDAESLGIVMGQTASSNVEKANDAFYRLTQLARGLMMQFSGALAPAIEYLTTALKDSVLKMAEAEGGIAKIGKVMAEEFVQGLITGITGFRDFINDVISGTNAVLTTMSKVAQTYYLITNQMAKYALAGFEPIQKVEFSSAIDGLNNVLDVIKDVNNETANNDNALEIVITRQKTAWEKIGDYIKAFKASFKSGVKATVDGAGELSMSIEKFAGESMGKFTQAFTDGITGAKKFSDAMKDMAKSVVDSLIKMLVQFYITQPLFQAITGQTVTTPTMTPPATGASSYGGTVSKGQAQIVGERGRELFIPNTNGAIVNSDQLQGGSGLVIQQTINVTTGVQQTVKAEIMNLMPQIANSAKQAVADARMRGGSYHKSLVGA